MAEPMRLTADGLVEGIIGGRDTESTNQLIPSPPRGERVRVRGRRPASVENYCANNREIAPNFLIRESQRAVSEPPQLLIANRIVFRAVQRTVEFENQLFFQTDKIDDVAADRHLSFELEPTEFAVADFGPEEFSVLAGARRICFARSRFSASASRLFSVIAPTTPSPLPSPPAGEREKIGYKRR